MWILRLYEQVDKCEEEKFLPFAINLVFFWGDYTNTLHLSQTCLCRRIYQALNVRFTYLSMGQDIILE